MDGLIVFDGHNFCTEEQNYLLSSQAGIWVDEIMIMPVHLTTFV